MHPVSLKRARSRFVSTALLALGALAGAITLTAATPNVAHAQTADKVLLRVDRGNGDCILTTDGSEAISLLTTQNGTSIQKIGRVFSSATGAYTWPIYRLYKSSTDIHYVTIFDAEKNTLISNGWTLDGVIGYVRPWAQSNVYTPAANEIAAFKFEDGDHNCFMWTQTPWGISGLNFELWPSYFSRSSDSSNAYNTIYDSLLKGGDWRAADPSFYMQKL